MMPSAVGTHQTGPAEEMRNNLFCREPFGNFYDLVGLFGGVGAMRSDGMRRWEGNAWSIESHSDSRAEKALAFLRR